VKNGFAFLLGAALALGVLELTARRTLDVPPFVEHPQLGSIRHRQRVVWGVEGGGVSHWLENGIRDNGNGPVHPSQRLLVLGDSYTEALQVNDRETFCSLAEAELRAGGWSVELLNAGRANRSPADYVQLGPAYLQHFRPDRVILVLDAYDLSGDGWDEQRNHFAYQKGRLTVAAPLPDPPESAGDWLPLLRVLPEGLAGLASRRVGEFRQRWSLQPPLFEAGSPAPAEVERDGPVEAVVALLARTFGPRCTLVYIAPFQPWGQPQRTPLERRFFAACREQSVDVLDLSEGHAWLRQQGRAPQGFANSRYNKGHANRWGHRMIARVLARHLTRLRQKM
jgi:hypothetical protein